MTTTISASPQTLADSAKQLTHHGSIYRHRGLSHRVAFPNPTQLQPSLAKRRTKADHRLLSELDRTHSNSKRHFSHKAMGKRMFFLLSGRHHMEKLGPSSSYETVSTLEEKVSPKLNKQLPSFRDGFPHWCQDASHINAIQTEDDLNRTSSGQGDLRVRLPSISALLQG